MEEPPQMRVQQDISDPSQADEDGAKEKHLAPWRKPVEPKEKPIGHAGNRSDLAAITGEAELRAGLIRSRDQRLILLTSIAQ
jgi:hypothetical protein